MQAECRVIAILYINKALEVAMFVGEGAVREPQQTSLLGSIALVGVCRNLPKRVNFDKPRDKLVAVVGVFRGL